MDWKKIAVSKVGSRGKSYWEKKWEMSEKEERKKRIESEAERGVYST